MQENRVDSNNMDNDRQNQGIVRLGICHWLDLYRQTVSDVTCLLVGPSQVPIINYAE